MAVPGCKKLEFPRFGHELGSICSIENQRDIPFDIKRVFYIYDVPTGESRGAHAHRKCHQVLVCLSGSFTAELNDGKHQDRVLLDRPWLGLHIPPMVWAAEVEFDPGSVCMVLTSESYDEKDYIRNFDDFLAVRGSRT